MSSYNYDLIVLGGGAAGVTAAANASAMGARVLLIEKEMELGGECLRSGCIPSKTLVRTAGVYNLMRRADRYGLQAPALPPVDFARIRDHIARSVASVQEAYRPVLLREKFNIDIEFGAPRFVEANTIVLEGRKITAGRFILACGSRPQLPEIEGLGSVPVLTNREIYRLDRLPASMIILGGGPHALETAQSFARLGTAVTLVDFHHRVLAMEDQDVAEFILHFLRKDGVDIRVNHKTLGVAATAGGVRVTAQDSLREKEVSLEAECLFVAVGRRANVEGLDLGKIGVAVEPDRVRVDRFLRTTVPHIFAAGDINAEFPFAHAAMYQAGIAAHNALRPVAQAAEHALIPRNIYLDPEIATVGYNETRAHAEGVRVTVQIEHFRDNARAVAEGDTEGFLKLILRDETPIGVQIVGTGAGDLIGEWLHVLSGRVSLARLARSVHPYPTRGGLNQTAGGVFSFPKCVDSPVAQWLRPR